MTGEVSPQFTKETWFPRLNALREFQEKQKKETAGTPLTPLTEQLDGVTDLVMKGFSERFTPKLREPLEELRDDTDD